MRFFVTEEQLAALRADFKQSNVSLEKWFDWGGLDQIDKLVGENNSNHPIDWDDDFSVEQMNELYDFIRQNI